MMVATGFTAATTMTSSAAARARTTWWGSTATTRSAAGTTMMCCGAGGRVDYWVDAGTDFLYGGKGEDLLLGENGDDWLFGGDGDDDAEGRVGRRSPLRRRRNGHRELSGRPCHRYGQSRHRLWHRRDSPPVMFCMRSKISAAVSLEMTSAAIRGTIASRVSRELIIIFGNSGDDTLEGGSDDDSINGGPGVDHLDGGYGIDTAGGRRGRRLFVRWHQTWLRLGQQPALRRRG